MARFRACSLCRCSLGLLLGGYIFVLILLFVSSYFYVCPHARCGGVNLGPHTLYMCPHTTMCPHTMSMSDIYYTIFVLMLVVEVLIRHHTLLYMRPHTSICVLILVYVSSSCVLILYIRVLILLYVSSYSYVSSSYFFFLALREGAR